MRHAVQLVAAVMLAAGAVLCWPSVTSRVDVPPVAEGQPATVAVVYHAPMMVLILLLITTAGVCLVLGVAGLRRRPRRTS